jgi:hypothetical protein
MPTDVTSCVLSALRRSGPLVAPPHRCPHRPTTRTTLVLPLAPSCGAMFARGPTSRNVMRGAEYDASNSIVSWAGATRTHSHVHTHELSNNSICATCACAHLPTPSYLAKLDANNTLRRRRTRKLSARYRNPRSGRGPETYVRRPGHPLCLACQAVHTQTCLSGLLTSPHSLPWTSLLTRDQNLYSR